MDRTRRLAGVWSWLLPFRTVAESEHLPTAGERLHVSPAALSRSIRLLEETLDIELFERANRRIKLNERGALLLDHLRGAMRMIDDGLEAALSDDIRGPLIVSAPGPFASLYVLPAMVALTKRHPRIEPHVVSAGPAEVVKRLRSGQLDIALLDDPVGDPELRIERFTELEYGVYCGPEHPLYKRRRAALDTVLEHDFAAPPAPGDDHWPKQLQRKVRYRLSSLQHGVELCGQGACLAVLPKVVAESARIRLRRLPVDGFPPAALYLVYRRPMAASSRTAIAVEALKRFA